MRISWLQRGVTDQRQTLMRRSISTAYHSAFHLFIEDFVEHWEIPDQRARLGRMFGHGKLCNAFTPSELWRAAGVDLAASRLVNCREARISAMRREFWKNGVYEAPLCRNRLE